jgi:predicted transcriptional regulator
MEVSTSMNILVIILSVVLAVFLLLSIIIAVQVIRLMRTIDRLAKKAESVMETAESVGRVFKNVSGPLAAARLVQNIVEGVVKHNKRGD